MLDLKSSSSHTLRNPLSDRLSCCSSGGMEFTRCLRLSGGLSFIRVLRQSWCLGICRSLSLSSFLALASLPSLPFASHQASSKPQAKPWLKFIEKDN